MSDAVRKKIVRVTCPECGQSVAVTKTGKLYVHYLLDPPRTCDGYGRQVSGPTAFTEAEYLRAQLAAKEAVIARLVEALEHERHCPDCAMGTSEDCTLCDADIAIAAARGEAK